MGIINNTIKDLQDQVKTNFMVKELSYHDSLYFIYATDLKPIFVVDTDYNFILLKRSDLELYPHNFVFHAALQDAPFTAQKEWTRIDSIDSLLFDHIINFLGHYCERKIHSTVG
ncbi:hypothetical protein [Sphingobacterium paludis]|uniref:Uncharacterized protein n=1 Tax=Sphingobacterium paludis TaxID=1476465 RepID=A0A4R7CWN0_9SPHI|nr:hypothetical protein [Sphingobacterium paludis]TDS08921.1 hypothetical protein B0I21_11150 [Sphingobacterium paludis]